MEKWNHSPPLLRRRVILTLLLGTACISIAVVMFFLSGDRILLTLSSLIFACCLFRSFMLLRITLRGEYDTITGTCTNIQAESFHKCRRIYLLDDTGNETTLILGKQSKIKPGTSYRFYFQRNGPALLDNDYLDAMLVTNQFLGCEEIVPELPE